MSTSANNNYDAIEKMIFEENIRIEAVDIHPELDVMLIILNTKAVLRQNISSHQRLKKANHKDLFNFQLLAGGLGIHWQELDEDLSLKGFLRDELKKVIIDKGMKVA
ncbi:MAG: DUF2442 domain-containing protein [Bacteroidetes bacterium]|nr:DUF2442 domain-containing protein [Bacteroidota bacterium]MBS1633722.1 DUF2442 domain-containing protein [Bacteroidota bacterium]